MANRDLTLTPRTEEVRDKQNTEAVVFFNLAQIKSHFEDNVTTIEKQFNIADGLGLDEKSEECNTIYRTQIVLLESAFDFYIHELSKYGVINIFEDNWPKTERYQNMLIPMKHVEIGLASRESNTWLLEFINQRFARDTYTDYEPLNDQLNLLGINLTEALKKAFPKPRFPDASYREGKTILRDLFRRRNQIAHQSDRKHSNAEHNTINKDYVVKCINEVKVIVAAIHAKAELLSSN